jgi:hypothetical protein
VYMYTFSLRMADTVTSWNTGLSAWRILYMELVFYYVVCNLVWRLL